MACYWIIGIVYGPNNVSLCQGLQAAGSSRLNTKLYRNKCEQLPVALAGAFASFTASFGDSRVRGSSAPASSLPSKTSLTPVAAPSDFVAIDLSYTAQNTHAVWPSLPRIKLIGCSFDNLRREIE